MQHWGRVLILALLGGFLAGVLAWPAALRWNIFGTASLFNSIVQTHNTVTKIEERTIVAPQAEYFASAIEKIRKQIVAVQSFSQGKLIRSGSGLILTQDGLIATVGSVVPSNAQIYQVSLEGKIYKARVVYRGSDNFVLLSINENGLSAVQLETKLPKLGDNLLVFSRQTELGKDQPLLAPALVAQLDTDKNLIRLSLNYADNLFGAALLDQQGSVVGMIDFKSGQAVPLLAGNLSTQLNSYLAKARQ